MKEWSSQEQELLLAVIANDLDQVKRLLPLHENTSFIDDIGQMKLPFPLHYITLCNKAIWRCPEEWSDKEMATKINDKVDEMLGYWKVYLNIDSFPEIDYISFCEDSWNLRWKGNDICGVDAEEYINEGYAEKDVKLYIAATHFEFEKVRELLNEGASPKTWFTLPEDENNRINILKCLHAEIMHLIDELYYIMIGKSQESDWIRLHQLSALAANSEMHRLLSNHPTEEQP